MSEKRKAILRVFKVGDLENPETLKSIQTVLKVDDGEYKSNSEWIATAGIGILMFALILGFLFR